ncbi:MAG: hypothetical protein M3Y90_00850 [Actinomycetota bacterium]|nr:hypothetical protein [Actinomycetota bacterium]
MRAASPVPVAREATAVSAACWAVAVTVALAVTVATAVMVSTVLLPATGVPAVPAAVSV